MPTLDDFVARWAGVLEVWRAEADMSLSRLGLIEQLHSWFQGGMFQRCQPTAGAFPKKQHSLLAVTKEQKWGKYRDEVMTRIGVLEGEGWATVYTDGLAKQVGVWWQTGYGVCFGEG